MQSAVRTYDAKLDSRNRITLRNAAYEYYNVQEYKDGRIVMEPRVLASPFTVSAKTLSMMDSGIKNLKAGLVSEALDSSEFQKT